MDVPRCTLPFPISAILADEAFEIPRLGGLRNLSHKLLVDLNAQTWPLQSLDETILDGESFWVCDVAVNIVLASCAGRRKLVSKVSVNSFGIELFTFDVVVHSYRHLLNLMVGCGNSDLETSGESDWAQGAVRCYCYVVCFCHCCDSTEFGDAAAVCDVHTLSDISTTMTTAPIVLTWLYNINRSVLEESLEVPARVQSLSKRNRTCRLSVELFDAFRMLAKKRLLNEQRMVRLESLSELLRHRLVQSSMEIDSSVHAERLHSLKSFHARLQYLRRVQPSNIFGSIHLNRLETLRQTLLSCAFDIARPVATNPGIHAHPVADFASQ